MQTARGAGAHSRFRIEQQLAGAAERQDANSRGWSERNRRNQDCAAHAA